MPPNYNPEDEDWEFKPGSVVRIELRQLPGGEAYVATGRRFLEGRRSSARSWNPRYNALAMRLFLLVTSLLLTACGPSPSAPR